MAACPRCGNRDAYVGVRAVECPNSKCPNYVKPDPPEFDGFSLDDFEIDLDDSDDELAIDPNDLS